MINIKNLIVGPFSTNCYILTSNKETIIIDPGAGLKKILKEIEGGKTNFIILTHYHWDHTSEALKLKEKTGAKILIGEKEKSFIKFEPDKFLEDNEEIKISDNILKVVHTPGHTKGSICLIGENFIFTGDTLFDNGVGRTDLPGGCQKDLEVSLKKLGRIIKQGMKVYSGHGSVFEKS